ncbi:MAG: ComEC/Rec2 family competence protein [Ginsengibacter sp.]
MRKLYQIFIWKKAPFLRLLIPVISGIIFQFYFKTGITVISSFAVIFLTGFLLFSFLPEALRFRLRVSQGIIIFLFLIAFGSLITWRKDARNDLDWYGKYFQPQSFIVATIDEPPVEKAKSFKAVAVAENVINKGMQHKTSGNFLIYFDKDSASRKLKYGDKIIFQKGLTEIKGSGNPGGFDYAQYAAFHQLFHQAYLKQNQWILLKEKNKKWWPQFIYATRENVVSILEKFLGNNNESSIAKALLIGYKVDLDKDLVQAYSNAGVVHLIAISGLHMGIIYGVLVWIFSLLPFIKKAKPIRLVLIIFCLWLFALLTGASPSVLRAAVMFSFIVAGTAFNKKSSVYNSLAASAFLLLCFNPFILWDVGFQLSYLAVLGIVVAQKNISNWLYFKNKYTQGAWQLAAVSLSAQLFTFPLCFYYFHQLPLLFLFSNMLAIPLATFALWGCLILVFISPISIAAFYFGKAVYGIIWLLNHTVLFFDSLPFALWQGVSVSLIETILMYILVCGFLYAFIKKNKTAFKTAIAFSLIFASFIAFDNWHAYSQKKLIVYNIPMHQAIELIDSNNFHFIGDSIVIKDKLLNGFNIKPAHVLFKIKENSLPVNTSDFNNNFYQFYNSRILLIDSTIKFSSDKKVDLDYIIFSKNTRINLADLALAFNCKKYIFDASNFAWKIQQWKKECEELHLQFHSVPEQGAFVINL